MTDHDVPRGRDTGPRGTFPPTVIVGPSGVGKGTVVARLVERFPVVWVSVSVTTRAPRPGDVDGVTYHFLTDAQFDALIAADGLLEWAEVFGLARYGTPLEPVLAKMGEGRAVVLELDIQGARLARARVPGTRVVFIAPPSLEELERRLRGRRTESEAQIERRLETARRELASRGEWDAVIVNDDVDDAVDELVNFIGLDVG